MLAFVSFFSIFIGKFVYIRDGWLSSCVCVRVCFALTLCNLGWGFFHVFLSSFKNARWEMPAVPAVQHLI